jgi:hypothetical protein
MTEPLPSRAQVVIVGEGILGCSIAHHLVKSGVGDVNPRGDVGVDVPRGWDCDIRAQRLAPGRSSTDVLALNPGNGDRECMLRF